MRLEQGHHLIAGAPQRAPGGATFRAVDPRTGAAVGAPFPEAGEGEVSDAVAQAVGAASALADAPLGQRESLLRAVARHLEGRADEIVEAADSETGLGVPRLEGELARTCSQLRLFADVVADGSFLDVVIDTATETTPDLRRYMVPLGPVAVFGASNFPLAFSVAGGDTASALAAGCPVIVKAHPAHPATSQLCGEGIASAVTEVGLPAGVFSLLHASGVGAAQALVKAQGVAAVGFTGSLEAGRAIHDAASARDVPIPVYAEMGSLNPMVVTPAAAADRTTQIAESFVSAMTLGVGQFCTKPGLLFVPDDEAGRRLERAIAGTIESSVVGCLLHPGVRDRLVTSTTQLRELASVEQLAIGALAGEGITHPAEVFATDTTSLTLDPVILAEHFGPVALLVRYSSVEDLSRTIEQLPGSLTGTVHAGSDEDELRRELQRVLLTRVGRVIHDGVPTGVAVTHAMHHGGPYPATTSPLHTSVGSTAIRRFQRPVTLQSAPPTALPPCAQDHNPLGLWRRVNGRLTTSSLD